MDASITPKLEKQLYVSFEHMHTFVCAAVRRHHKHKLLQAYIRLQVGVFITSFITYCFQRKASLSTSIAFRAAICVFQSCFKEKEKRNGKLCLLTQVCIHQQESTKLHLQHDPRS